MDEEARQPGGKKCQKLPSLQDCSTEKAQWFAHNGMNVESNQTHVSVGGCSVAMHGTSSKFLHEGKTVKLTCCEGGKDGGGCVVDDNNDTVKAWCDRLRMFRLDKSQRMKLQNLECTRGLSTRHRGVQQ